MSHTSFFPKQNNNSIVSFVYQFYSSKGLLFQSPLYTNLDTLYLDSLKKSFVYDEPLTMELVKFD